MRVVNETTASKILQRLCTAAGLILITACASNPDQEVVEAMTADGLVRVADSRADYVYRDPDANIGIYDEIYIAPVDVSFKSNWQNDINRQRTSLSHKVSQEDADRIKADVAELFHEVFTDELSKRGYTMQDAIDPKGKNETLLIVSPAIIDLDVAAPDVRSAGRDRSYTASAGSMTLGLELIDSINGDVLARAMDYKEDRDYGTLRFSNSVTNRADATRMIRQWAVMLADALDEARGA